MLEEMDKDETIKNLNKLIRQKEAEIRELNRRLNEPVDISGTIKYLRMHGVCLVYVGDTTMREYFDEILSNSPISQQDFMLFSESGHCCIFDLPDDIKKSLHRHVRYPCYIPDENY